jgi:hypothetical protein
MIKNQRGIAMLETLPLLVVFMVLLGSVLGMYGIIHTAVLHSIAARTYSFETFRNRTNLYFFREDGSAISLNRHLNYAKKGWRYHAVQKEGDSRERFVATDRPISFGRKVANIEASQEVHNSQIFGMQTRNEKIGVSPAWVMVGYGICLNANCGN